MPLFGPPNVEKLKAKKNVKGLIKALRYEKDAKVRQDAIWALGQIGDPRAVEALIDSLKDESEKARKDAVQALDALKWKPDKSEAGAAYWIQKGKNDKNETVWQSAINALGQIGEPAVKPLIAELGSDDWTTSSNAATALGLIGDARAVEPLIVTIAQHHTSNSVVHIAAVKALGQLGGARAVESLIAALRNETSKVHEAAIEALGQIGASAVDPLIALFKESNNIVRTAAIMALGQTGNSRAVEPLIAALKDTDWYPRNKAAEALGLINDPRAVEPLITTLEDTDVLVRKSAAETLDILGWKPDISNAGAWYWIAKGDYKNCVAIGDEAVEPLIALLKDKNEKVRTAAVKALGQIGDPRAVEALIKTLYDNETYMRRGAAIVLVELYHSTRLDDKVKRSILASRDAIMQPHIDETNESSEMSCDFHYDYSSHNDLAGIMFPL